MARFEEQLRRFNEVLDKSMSLKFAVEGVLFDKVMQAKSLMFMRVVIVWLLRIATNSNYTPDKTIKYAFQVQRNSPPNFSIGCHSRKNSRKHSDSCQNTFWRISSAISTSFSGKACQSLLVNCLSLNKQQFCARGYDIGCG